MATAVKEKTKVNLKTYKNLMALKLADNSHVAFHAHNMSLATISPEAWNSLSESPLKELSDWSSLQDNEAKDAKSPNFINSLSINVSQVCNLKCTYCGADGDGTYGSKVPRLELERIKKQVLWIAKKLPSNETLNIHFLGGEPLLYPTTIQYIADQLHEAFPKLAINYSITTNGTLINKRSAHLLASLNAAVTVSIDGPEEINDRYRPVKAKKTKNKQSSTEMTVAGLKALKAVRNELSALNINSVFGEHNVDVIATYAFLQTLDLGFDFYNFNYANNANNTYVTKQYLQNMKLLAEKVYQQYGLAGLAQITQFRSALSRLEAQTRSHSYCGAGKSLLQIDTSHKLYPCNWFMNDAEEVVGEDTDLDAKKWSHYSDNLIKLNDCSTCWNRHICAGGCMSVHKEATGDKHQKDPLFCERSRSLSALAIYYYAQELTKGEKHETH